MSDYDVNTAAGQAQTTVQDESKKVSFRFCRECSNMLYPLEDHMNHRLMFACRSCQYSEDAVATCIYRNSLKEEVAETAGNVQDVAQDPTVGSSASEQQSESQNQDEMDFEMDEDPMAALCTMCGSEILCPFCGGPSDGGMLLETYDPDAGESESKETQIELERRERALSGAVKPSY